MDVCSKRSYFILAFAIVVVIMIVADNSVVFNTVKQRLQNSSLKFYLRRNSIKEWIR